MYLKNLNILLTLAEKVPKVKVLKILVQSENDIKRLPSGHNQWGYTILVKGRNVYLWSIYDFVMLFFPVQNIKLGL